MSLRALKRLNKDNLEDELKRLQSPISEGDFDQENKEEEEKPMQQVVNAFSMLNDDDDESSEEEVEKEEVTPVLVKQVAKLKAKQPQQKAIKKSQNVDDLDDDELDKLLADLKVKDRNQTPTGDLFSSDDEGDIYESADDEGFDDDDGNLIPFPMFAQGGKLLTPKKFKRVSHLLKLNPRDLNPDREYENLFGKLSTAAIDSADSTSSSFVTPEVLKEIKKLSKRVRGWSGRDHRSIPGTNRKLILTKIRDDWIPIQKKPISLEEIDKTNLLALFQTKYKNDWKDIIEEDLNKDLKSGLKYYQISTGPMYSTASTTEFFMSTCIQPDHESLIRLLQRSPYSLETILQVASILQRQGDNSNTNGLIERALFLFDWSLPNSFELGDAQSRLPFEFFLNRQIYLTLFRYITVLTQKSTYFTAFTYSKLILSFDPNDDPYGVRYFIDYYAFMASEFEWIIEFFQSSLCQCYSEWRTPSLMYTVSMSYFQIGEKTKAIEHLKLAYLNHPYTGHEILEKLGDVNHPWLLKDVSDSVKLASAIYSVRLPMLCEDLPMKQFILKELAMIIENVGKPNLDGYYLNNKKEIPLNLIRHVILSNESSAMAKIPESFWKENEVYEFDLLPPSIGTTVYNYIDDEKMTQEMMMHSMQTEEIRQMDDLLRQNIREE